MTEKRFNLKNADKLISEERKTTLQPEKIIDYLNVTSGDTVADLGAGPGLFAIPLAKRTERNVYAVDVEPEMLKRLNAHAAEENIENIKPVVSDLENIDLADNSVTRILNAFVIHEVGSIDQTIEEMKRILEPGGQVLLMDWEAVESESGPPLEIRIPSEKMGKMLKDHGFDISILYPSAEHYAIKALKE
ncbi:Methyltransferase domain-containing protein [Lentibacillus persicus]|uniref:Methyltransferase domain-containing protein n=1 Tax=Lentibacillus persicus TaxID=640948 RepID=A0A1I1SES9_9BACI|nr:Methyltransferase domain-containing protein [Lentibacillus persicus]